MPKTTVIMTRMPASWHEYDLLIDGEEATVVIEDVLDVGQSEETGDIFVRDIYGVIHTIFISAYPLVSKRIKEEEAVEERAEIEPSFWDEYLKDMGALGFKQNTPAPMSADEVSACDCPNCTAMNGSADMVAMPATITDLFTRLGQGGAFATEELEAAAKFFRDAEDRITRGES